MCRPRVDLADCLQPGGPEDDAQHQNLDEVVFGSGLRHVPGMGKRHRKQKGQISKRSKDVPDVYCEGTVPVPED
jgi:hypothetical protein